MARELHIGKLIGVSGDLILPLDCGTHTFAAVGQRGSGKSSLGMVMAEEMCNAGIPWAAIDRVGNWRGLKWLKNGKAAHRIVCFGGKSADLPFEPMQGAMIAEAVARSGVHVVIDCYGVDLIDQQRFVRDFCRHLEKVDPPQATHIFFEETAEYAPQKPADRIAAQCHDAVASLFLLGRNWGYGATALLQRPADVSKKVLSQCETLLMLRTSGSHDTKALKSWQGSYGSDKSIERTMKDLSTLDDGEGFCWSPKYLGLVEKFKVRERETFHPGETRKANTVAIKKFDAEDVSDFVSKLRREMSKTAVAVIDHVPAAQMKTLEKSLRSVGTDHRIMVEKQATALNAQVAELQKTIEDLKVELQNERNSGKKAKACLQKVRAKLKPEYDLLKSILEETGDADVSGTDDGVYEKWLVLARKRGCGKMLEVLIQDREITKDQLGIKSGVSPKKSTWRAYMAWLKRANLIEIDGDTIRLKAA